MVRQEISDEEWAVIAPLLPVAVGRSRPWLDHRAVVEGIVWRFRTGAPWRDVPERFGPWNTIYKRFDRWARDGTWDRLLADSNVLRGRLWILVLLATACAPRAGFAGSKRVEVRS